MAWKKAIDKNGLLSSSAARRVQREKERAVNISGITVVKTRNAPEMV